MQCNAGKVPVARGTRRVTPGSEIITARLRSLGLLDAYEVFIASYRFSLAPFVAMCTDHVFEGAVLYCCFKSDNTIAPVI
jgi:hypothetical protein